MSARCSQGNVTISNDGATIMKKLEIVHPAAKTLVDISLSQDAEACLAIARLVLVTPGKQCLHESYHDKAIVMKAAGAAGW